MAFYRTKFKPKVELFKGYFTAFLLHKNNRLWLFHKTYHFGEAFATHFQQVTSPSRGATQNTRMVFLTAKAGILTNIFLSLKIYILWSVQSKVMVSDRGVNRLDDRLATLPVSDLYLSAHPSTPVIDSWLFITSLVTDPEEFRFSHFSLQKGKCEHKVRKWS